MSKVLVILILVGIFFLLRKFDEQRRVSQLPRCARHNVRGLCSLCELEAAFARRDAQEQSQLAIEKEYLLIPDEKRHQLRCLAEEHISRNAIVTRPGSIESAVVYMWRRSQEAKSRRVGRDHG
jgi:hypothetical protein